jgi:hypothetical protein
LLNSPSSDVQLIAAQALSFFASGVSVPTPQSTPGLSYLNQRQASSYHTADTEQHLGYATGQEAPYVAYWKSWWAQHPELSTPAN